MPSASFIDGLAPMLSLQAVRDGVDQEILASLRQEGSLVDVAEANEFLDGDQLAFLRGVPQTLREGIRATMVQAVRMGKAVHLQYSPAYEFGLQVSDFGEGVSVHLSGPYPEGTRPDFVNEPLPTQ